MRRLAAAAGLAAVAVVHVWQWTRLKHMAFYLAQQADQLLVDGERLAVVLAALEPDVACDLAAYLANIDGPALADLVVDELRRDLRRPDGLDAETFEDLIRAAALATAIRVLSGAETTAAVGEFPQAS